MTPDPRTNPDDEAWLSQLGRVRVDEKAEGEGAGSVWTVLWLESQERYKVRAVAEDLPSEPLEFHAQAPTRAAALAAVRRLVERDEGLRSPADR